MKPRHLIAAVICVLLLAYPLSTGPVVMALHKNHLAKTPPDWVVKALGLNHLTERPPRWFVVVYYPLIQACFCSRTIRDALDWYIDLWLPPEERIERPS